MKRSIAILVAALTTATGLVVAAPAANAHTVCSGSLIDTYDVRTSGRGTGGTRYAIIRLYYSSADGGTNCASLEKALWHGTARNDMYLEIGLCNDHGCARPPVSQLDTDHSPAAGYLYYAGPVTRSNARYKCVYLSAHMYNTPGPTGTKAWRTVRGVHGPGCPDD